MQFEWDEAKRLSNLEKHRIDFADAKQLFDGRPVLEAESLYAHEERFLITGMIDDRLVTVIWTRRGDAIRLIPARRSRDGEERAYRAVHIVRA